MTINNLITDYNLKQMDCNCESRMVNCGNCREKHGPLWHNHWCKTL